MTQQFQRVHRSYIINVEKIDTIESSGILIGSDYVPISQSYEKFSIRN
ncbi:LytTR family transcriptional regulator DNA-binding domain-containing protein [Urechidicola croceus]